MVLFLGKDPNHAGGNRYSTDKIGDSTKEATICIKYWLNLVLLTLAKNFVKENPWPMHFGRVATNFFLKSKIRKGIFFLHA